MKKYTVLLLFFTILLFAAKFHVALVRSFDPDEFVHLHTAWLLHAGFTPYRDFFMGVIPLFQWIISPLFLLPDSVILPVVGRVLIFFYYTLTLILLYLITKHITKLTIPSALTVAIALIFPITFDRVLDVRPDTLMMTMFLGSVLLLINPSSKKYSVLISGVLYAVSFLIYMKIAFAAPAVGLLLYMKNRKKLFPIFISFIIGCSIPIVLTVFSLWGTGILSDTITGITRDALAFTSDVNFSPIAALTPWPIIYVASPGVSIPWIVSSLLWILTIIGIPLLILKNKKIGLFFFTYFLSGILYMFTFPRPHTQIFIPFVLMGSILASLTIFYGTSYLKDHVRKPFRIPVLVIAGTLVTLLFTASFFIQYQSRLASNPQQKEQFDALRSIISAVPKNESVYDMAGSYIFRPDASYVCCHQCPECTEKLSRPVGSIKENLIAKQTKFILLDQQGYVFWKPRPSDLQFIVTHYLPSRWFKLYVPGVKFVCTNRQCVQYNLHGMKAFVFPTASFDLPIKGNYQLHTEPEGQTVFVKGISINDGDVRQFDEVNYWFTPSVSFSLLFFEDK